MDAMVQWLKPRVRRTCDGKFAVEPRTNGPLCPQDSIFPSPSTSNVAGQHDSNRPTPPRAGTEP